MKSKWPKNYEPQRVTLTKPEWVAVEVANRGIQPIYGRKRA